MASRVVKQNIPGEPKLGIKQPKPTKAPCPGGKDADGEKQKKM